MHRFSSDISLVSKVYHQTRKEAQLCKEWVYIKKKSQNNGDESTFTLFGARRGEK